MTSTNPKTRTAIAVAATAAALLLLLHGGTELSALQKMAGYASGKTFFKDAQEYLDNLRDSLIPLRSRSARSA